MLASGDYSWIWHWCGNDYDLSNDMELAFCNRAQGILRISPQQDVNVALDRSSPIGRKWTRRNNRVLLSCFGKELQMHNTFPQPSMLIESWLFRVADEIQDGSLSAFPACSPSVGGEFARALSPEKDTSGDFGATVCRVGKVRLCSRKPFSSLFVPFARSILHSRKRLISDSVELYTKPRFILLQSGFAITFKGRRRDLSLVLAVDVILGRTTNNLVLSRSEALFPVIDRH
jgi:hypothetical protein